MNNNIHYVRLGQIGQTNKLIRRLGYPLIWDTSTKAQVDCEPGKINGKLHSWKLYTSYVFENHVPNSYCLYIVLL